MQMYFRNSDKLKIRSPETDQENPGLTDTQGPGAFKMAGSPSFNERGIRDKLGDPEARISIKCHPFLCP